VAAVSYFTADTDPLTQTKTIIHEIPKGNDVDWVIESKQDATDLIEANKRAYNSVDERARFGEHFVRVASIPMNLAMQLHAEGRLNESNGRDFMRWLDNPDNKYFRTRPGSLSK
jgi:hypothetical protein